MKTTTHGSSPGGTVVIGGIGGVGGNSSYRLGGTVTMNAGTGYASGSGGNVTITGGFLKKVYCCICKEWIYNEDLQKHASKFEDDLHKTMEIVDG